VPTATSESSRRPRSANKYLLRALVTGFGLFGLLRLPWIEAHLVLPVTRLQGEVAASVFNTPSAPISVTLACSGTEVIAMCLGAVLAYPVRWSARALGAVMILAVILGLNTVRIGTLGLVVSDPSWFDALHLYLWPAFLALASAGAVFWWMRHADHTTTTATTTTTSAIAPSWRFVSLAMVLLVLSALTAPMYIESAAVEVFGALIAATAAVLLTTAGALAHATGNILWTSRGGFSVTGDCVATPLVPLYLAAVWVYAPTWAHKMLGTVAAVPIFLLLGVVRLLLVAVPQTMAAPETATHAFYQVVLAVVLVVIAGRWQHGLRSAFLPIIGGLVAGTLLVLVAGGVYTDLVLRPMPQPFLDPQGAVTFLPAFQIGLFVAVGIAAVRGVRWPMVGIGLLLLVASHVAGAWWLNHTGVPALLAAHISAVRAWAVAGPLLILSVMVAHAHTRR
jgi:exosortase/archaeosortase family protein